VDRQGPDEVVAAYLAEHPEEACHRDEVWDHTDRIGWMLVPLKSASVAAD
jgi:hypothetical protein